ncbi:homoserine kinase [Methanobrevibacter woesei]|uniref:Shikimate kinase n=1 Tax=Methanobrevibacter woesei TaxID=190976 RepID=A0A2U1S8K3_9EURY|nr:shikimate kinase [Methanobrevibacter woesei]PWB86618.1 homoserine kinase [Methanobrevibacter woesei]
MKKVVRSPGSATIINAIATGFGSAFGIGLDIVCNAKTQSHSITCSNDVGADTSLMELCVSNVFDYYNINTDEFGLDIKTTSELPMASGLSSSSALSNAVTAICSKIISEEFNLEPLSDFDIINLAIESSLKAKVTITGAFDDATASYFGGVTVTDNGARKILIKEPMEELPVLVYMPNFISKSGSSDVNKMKLMAPLVETAFEIAKNKDYFKALNLNGLIYAAALGFDSSIAIEALNAGALASGLSGTGSSFVAICEEDKIDDIKEAWSLLDGRVIETFSDNEGCSFI